ncbi:unnamed protein product [Amoebophrya sp. A120]|nr:unnamed protein product [Amoebophrya sp. A120]|eukprot:GSA120T00012841001.1
MKSPKTRTTMERSASSSSIKRDKSRSTSSRTASKGSIKEPANYKRKSSKLTLFLRFLGFLALFALAAFVYVRYGDALSLHALKNSKEKIEGMITRNPILGPIAYVGFQSACVGFNLPGATFLATCAGLFFPQPLASAIAYTGYMLGAMISFISWRLILGDSVHSFLDTSSTMFKKMEREIKNADNIIDTVASLIFIRYIAFFPFWFVNASQAAMGISFSYFTLLTAFSTVPGALLYPMTGRMLRQTLSEVTVETNTSEFVQALFIKAIYEDPAAQATFGLLVFCALLPVLLRLPKLFLTAGEAVMAATEVKQRTRGRSPTTRPATSSAERKRERVLKKAQREQLAASKKNS